MNTGITENKPSNGHQETGTISHLRHVETWIDSLRRGFFGDSEASAMHTMQPTIALAKIVAKGAQTTPGRNFLLA